MYVVFILALDVTIYNDPIAEDAPKALGLPAFLQDNHDFSFLKTKALISPPRKSNNLI